MDVEVAREYLLADRRAFVSRVIDCARAVAADWDGQTADGSASTSDREQVVPPFRAALDRAGLLARAPETLRGCVAAVGGDLRVSPVPAPPYVVVTSTGLVLRATLPNGRLIVRVEPFAVTRDPVRYRLVGTEPEAAVSVERR